MKALLNIELSHALLMKFLKFGVVGFSGVFVNFGVTYACKEWFKWNKYLSNILGFIVAASTNYLLNRIWTFQSNNPQIGREDVKYFGIALVGLGIDTATVWLLNGKLKWNFYLSKVFAVGASTLWNFFGNLLFTFAASTRSKACHFIIVREMVKRTKSLPLDLEAIGSGTVAE